MLICSQCNGKMDNKFIKKVTAEFAEEIKIPTPIDIYGIKLEHKKMLCI